jgi:hypothetical protein
MAHKKARGRAPYKARYAAYDSLSKYAKNKRAKVEAHLKAHPEDKQSEVALAKVGPYKRKASKSKGLSNVDKKFQQVKAMLLRATNALLYASKKFPSNPHDKDARTMATLRVEEWPSALRKKHRGKPESKDTSTDSALATA